MSVFNLLNRASFRGVEFFMDSGSENRGFKNVVHEYPDSDNVYVEQKGLKAKTLPITAIIKGTGQDYFDNKNALIEALNTPGNGTLIHPWLGALEVKATDVSSNETIGALNRVDFSITFIEERGQPQPFDDVIGVSEIDALKNTAQEAFDSFYLTNYDAYDLTAAGVNNVRRKILSTANVFTGALDNFKDFTEDFQTGFSDSNNPTIQQLTGLISDIKSITNSRDENVLELNKSITDLSDNAGFYTLQKNEQIAKNRDIFDKLEAVSKNEEKNFEAIQDLFDFGEDTEFETPITKNRENTNKNLKLVNINIQVQALIKAYAIASRIDYKTQREVDEKIDILEAQFEKVYVYDIDNNMRDALVDLRRSTLDYLRGLDLETIVEIDIKDDTPSTVLSFQYYGVSTRDTELTNLNGFLNVGFIEGATEILTSDEV